MELTLIGKIAVYALPIILAITVHEAAHGYTARHFGDMTAHAAGRISLNPLRHIDPFGTILVPLMLLMAGGILFGWAKPVPVNFGQLRRPKQDMLWVAAAGPGANLLMAVLWAVVLNISTHLSGSIAVPLSLMAQAGLAFNVVLMVLNLLPLPPLDGGRIAVSLLPPPWSWKFARIEPYGFIILLILIFTHILGKIIGPPIEAVISLILWLF